MQSRIKMQKNKIEFVEKMDYIFEKRYFHKFTNENVLKMRNTEIIYILIF